jgi:hypothetical protein
MENYKITFTRYLSLDDYRHNRPLGNQRVEWVDRLPDKDVLDLEFMGGEGASGKACCFVGGVFTVQTKDGSKDVDFPGLDFDDDEDAAAWTEDYEERFVKEVNRQIEDAII